MRLAVALALVLAVAAPPAWAQVCGDLNDDGFVDDLDADVLQDHLAGNVALDAWQAIHCDVINETRGAGLEPDPNVVDDVCSIADAAVMERTGAALPPGPSAVCAGSSGGPCCTAHAGIGCGFPNTVACVCGVDPTCCTQLWDATCAALACTGACADVCGDGIIGPTEQCEETADCTGVDEFCSAGCSCECAVGQPCGGNCVDTQTDVQNCGGCGIACTNPHGTTACVSGACVPTCSQNWGDCNGDGIDGCETALTTPSNCGACGVSCALPHASETCSTGTCQITSCDPGFCDEDGQPANGCEADLDADPACATFTSLGSIRGDTGGDSVQFSGHGERRFRIRLQEADSNPFACEDLSSTITLLPAPGTAYDLDVWCATCAGGPQWVSQNGGSLVDQVQTRWEEECILGVPSGSDSSNDLYIRVRFQDANVCADWQLQITGNTPGGTIRCGPF